MVHEDDDDCPKLIDLYLPPERRQDANVIDLFGPSQDAIALGEETPSSITLYRSSSMQDRTRFGLATIVINITTPKKYAVSTVEVPPTSHRWQTAVARKIIGPFANFHKPAFFLGGAPEERAADQHQRVVAIVRDIDPANWEKASLALELKLIEEETDASLAAWEAQLLCLFSSFPTACSASVGRNSAACSAVNGRPLVRLLACPSKRRACVQRIPPPSRSRVSAPRPGGTA